MARMARLAGMARMARLGIAAMTFSGMAVAPGGAVLAGPAAAQAVVTEERSVAGIAELELSGIGMLTLIQGETESLVITAEAAILPQLTSEVTDGRLTIEPQGSFSTSEPVTYELTVKDLSVIVLSGSAEIEGEEFATERLTVALAGSSTLTLDALTADDLTLTLEGSSEAELAGEVTRQRIELSGSSTYLAAGLASQEVVITAGGSSEATLRVSETLDAEVEGSATVEYHGDPTVRDDISGAGSLEPLH